jgi:predicted transcriptional regulator
LTRFNELPAVPGYEEADEPLPNGALELDPDAILHQFRVRLDGNAFVLYNQEPPRGDDWSSALWQLEMLLLEAGLSKEEVFAVCNASKCNKFKRDGHPPIYLWRDVVRAAVRLEARMRSIGADAEAVPQLLSPQEKKTVEGMESFVERFILWGKTRGDASPQYFEAGAFTILSTLLSGPVKLPTSFGTILPNLWFLILADTTLTRKSTAMDMAMDLLLEVDPDAVLATDGSIEGLMSSIASRPGRAGIFWRDEFSGLLAAIKQKDYLAGMGEALTKLYDGKYQKRILRKETIEIRDPIVLIFAGGIRSKILELLDHENITSGFLPRFIFIQAESDISNFKPIGPATDYSDADRGKLIAEMLNIRDEYNQETIIHVGEQKVKTNVEYRAELTEEAWNRYNDLERQMLEFGLGSGSPEVFTPTMDRLAKSGLKCAVLLAAARQKPKGAVVKVELNDVLHAIKFVQQWAVWSSDVVANVGKTVTEKKIELIWNAIKRGNGVSRSKLMQNYHLTARDTDWILDTLDQRGQIRRAKDGKSERLFPATIR